MAFKDPLYNAKKDILPIVNEILPFIPSSDKFKTAQTYVLVYEIRGRWNLQKLRLFIVALLRRNGAEQLKSYVSNSVIFDSSLVLEDWEFILNDATSVLKEHNMDLYYTIVVTSVKEGQLLLCNVQKKELNSMFQSDIFMWS